MKKRYDVRGMMEWHPEFRVGRTRLQVSFTGGHLCGGACTPASFETSDEVVQKVIEDSSAFRSGRIRIGMVMEGSHPGRRSERPREASDTERAESASGAVVSMTDPHNNIVMEFDSIDAASDFLQNEKGVPIDDVYTSEQCVAVARRLGIELVIRK